jgi:hypothetical protein
MLLTIESVNGFSVSEVFIKRLQEKFEDTGSGNYGINRRRTDNTMGKTG